MKSASPSPLSLVLASKDPAFAALLEHLLAPSPVRFITSTGPAITLECVRTNDPSLVLLDVDSMEPAEAQRLVLKLALVSPALLLLTGADAVPGLPSLDPLFLGGAHGVLPKPEGKTSLGLTGSAGKIYLEALLSLVQTLTRRRSP
jgi:hypothetical protein